MIRTFKLAALLTLLLIPVSTARAAGGAPRVTAPEAVVMDGWSGAILYAKSANVPRDPASTVKIMTALVVLRRHLPLHRWVTVTPLAAEYGGSTAGLYAGERMTVWNLLHGLLLPSGNDAAVALAQAVSGNLAAFVRLMNRQARRLHLWHTRYLSPNGFDMAGQLTTAHDLAVLARAALHYRIFDRVVRTKYWHARDAAGIVHIWRNLNQLLWASRSVDGVKTGTTPGAGACLVSSARKDGRWVIAVNMGSSEATRFTDGEALLDYGFSLAGSLPGAL